VSVRDRDRKNVLKTITSFKIIEDIKLERENINQSAERVLNYNILINLSFFLLKYYKMNTVQVNSS
jgi:hypothetical protein